MAAFWVVLSLSSVAGAFVALYMGFASMMASDGCVGDTTGWLCSSTGQLAAFAVPWLGLLAAIVAAVVGFSLRLRAAKAPWLGLLGGAVLYTLVLAGEWVAVDVVVG